MCPSLDPTSNGVLLRVLYPLLDASGPRRSPISSPCPYPYIYPYPFVSCRLLNTCRISRRRVLRFSLFDDTFAESFLAPPTVLLGFGTAGGTNAGKIRRLLRLNSGMANFMCDVDVCVCTTIVQSRFIGVYKTFPHQDTRHFICRRVGSCVVNRSVGEVMIVCFRRQAVHANKKTPPPEQQIVAKCKYVLLCTWAQRDAARTQGGFVLWPSTAWGSEAGSVLCRSCV